MMFTASPPRAVSLYLTFIQSLVHGSCFPASALSRWARTVAVVLRGSWVWPAFRDCRKPRRRASGGSRPGPKQSTSLGPSFPLPSGGSDTIGADRGRTKRPHSMPRDLYGPVVAGFHEGGRVEVEATPSRGQARRGSGLSALPRVTAGSQHRSSTTPPTGPEWTAAELSTKSARPGLGSFGVNEPKPLTCMFATSSSTC